MIAREDFDFLNSDLWLKYTQSRYAPLDDIQYRLEKLGIEKKDWPNLKLKIQSFRKMGAIPLFLDSIDKKFWYFPADSINKKIHKIETLGNHLLDKIENQSSFKQEFITNAAVEEAITSAIFEGANSTRSKAKALISSGNNAKTKDEWMLINNFKAMQWIKENANLPVSSELIQRIHEIVTLNTLEGDDANFCGKFRDDVVYVAHHEGISHDKIEETMDEVIKIVTNHGRFLHGVVKGIVFHYLIAYMHPFFDGNGRTARTVFYYQAMKSDLKFVELLSVSANLKEQVIRYEKAFDLVKSHDLDLTYFIDFCLDALLTALEKVEHKVNYLIGISDLINQMDLSVNQVCLLQRMALNKYCPISIEDYAATIEKSREIARRELKDLLEKSLIREVKVGKKFVYYVQSKKLHELIKL